MLGARTGRPASNKFVIDHDVGSDTAAESNLSLKSRSFLNRVNDRLRKILHHSSTDAMQHIDNRSSIWCMFMSSTLEASVFMGKNYSESLHSIKNTGNNLTLKQMFDISEKLIIEQLKSAGKVLHGDNYLWSSLSHAKVYVFSDSVLCLGKTHENPRSNTAWEDRLTWFKHSPQYRTLDTVDGEPMEFEWNISQDSPQCSSSTGSKSS